MKSPLKRACAGLLLCLAFATPGSSGNSPPSKSSRVAGAEPAIEIVDAVSHPSAGVAVGVIYLRVINHSNRGDRLIAVSSPAAVTAEFHETLTDRGLMKMKHRPEGFEIAAGGQLVLESGGRHIMLSELIGPLEDGNTVEIELAFEHAGKLLVKVPIRPR